MSDRRRIGIAILTIVLAPAAASAQQSVAAQQARLAALEAAANRADSIAHRADSVLQARRVLDTLRSGTLRVVTDSALAQRVRPAAAHAWRVLSAHLGADTVLLREPYGAIANRGSRLLPVAVEATALIDTAAPPLETFWTILGVVESNLVTRSGRTFRSWDGSLGFATDTTHLFSLAYVSLITAPSRAARLCRAGDVAACAAALGLGPDSNRAASWYSVNDLRVVLGRGTSSPFARDRRMLAACRAGSDSACWNLAARRGPSLPAPLGVVSRTSLIAIALARGGAGAYTRLLADSSAPVAAQLSSAAGMPFDDLIAAWRIRVRGAAPPGTTGAPIRAELAAAGWIVLLLALALRSARWRLD